MPSPFLCIFDIGFSQDVDGPGQRMVVYLKGCNLCCPWCAAPESIAFKPQVLFYPNRVEDRASAIAACPFAAVTNGESGELLRQTSLCAECPTFACADTGQRAFERVGEYRTVDAIIARAERYRGFLAAPGGVTIGGGEPSCQFEGVDALLTGLHAVGFHIAMETNGTHPNLPDLYPHLDLLLIDLKHPDALDCAGLSPGFVHNVLANIRCRRESGAAMQVRIPLVPGYNTDDATLHRFGVVLAAAGSPPVEILAFHRRGEVKWAALGLSMPASEVKDPSKALMNHAADVLSAHGISIIT